MRSAIASIVLPVSQVPPKPAPAGSHGSFQGRTPSPRRIDKDAPSIHIHMADSPDQPQLKTQKWTNVACELNKTYPINRTNIGVT